MNTRETDQADVRDTNKSQLDDDFLPRRARG